jgi:hypothetical protein
MRNRDTDSSIRDLLVTGCKWGVMLLGGKPIRELWVRQCPLGAAEVRLRGQKKYSGGRPGTELWQARLLMIS